MKKLGLTAHDFYDTCDYYFNQISTTLFKNFNLLKKCYT